MAGHGVDDFVARITTDEAFRHELFAAEVGEDRLAFVNGAGYDITAQELVDATSELTEEQLKAVTGGMLGSPVPHPIQKPPGEDCII